MPTRSLLVASAGVFSFLAACSEPAVNYDEVTGTPDLAIYVQTSELHAVATSGSYDQLEGKPDLGVYAKGQDLSPVARSGQYDDLTGTPDLSVYAPADVYAPIAFSGSYTDLVGLPDLSVYAPAEAYAPVAFSGSYTDLVGLPDLSVYAPSADLAPVASTGSYRDLTGVPDLSVYAPIESLADVALSNSYDDLDDTPWIRDGLQVHTNASVGIGGDTRNPLTVHATDHGPSVVDQVSPEAGGIYQPAVSHWQSFTPAVSGVLVGIDIHTGGNPTETGYTLNIYEGEGTGGRLIHSEPHAVVWRGFHTVAVGPVRLEASVLYTWELTHPTPFQLLGYNWSTYERGRGGQPTPGMSYHFATHMRPALETTSPGLTVTSMGNVSVGGQAATSTLDIDGDLRVRGSSSPASNDPCHQGQISWDAGYVYVCVQTNQWKRAQLLAY